MHRTARPSRSICGLPETCTNNKRQSQSRSNLGDTNQLATSRSNCAPVATPSTYRASTIRVHNTHSVASGYGGRSIRSATSHASRRLPRLRTATSFKRPESASPPTPRDAPSGASWWSQRTNHSGLVQRILRKHVGSKPTQIAPSGGQRSSARRHPRVSAIYVSSSKRQGHRHSTAPRLTWARRWHVSSRLILHPRSKQPWPTSESPQLWWRRRARRPSQPHPRQAGTRAADLIGLRIASSPRSRAGQPARSESRASC
jgi:hypothetical protein